MDSNKKLPDIIAKNMEGPDFGIDIFNSKFEESKVLKVYDNYASKVNAIKLSAKTAITILRIDQIIMAKPSGGPKPKSKKGWDND